MALPRYNRWRKNCDKEDACAHQEDLGACGSGDSDDDVVLDAAQDDNRFEESICDLSDEEVSTPLPLQSNVSTRRATECSFTPLMMPRASGHVDGADEAAPRGKGKQADEGWAAPEDVMEESQAAASGHKRKRVVRAASDSDD